MIFKNREQAGQLLAKKLQKFKNQKDAVILALPRGGVVIGKEVAVALHLLLDIVVPRKIGAPENPEYAIGAITEFGEGVWNEVEVGRVSKSWLTQEIEKEKKEAMRRRKKYRGNRPPISLESKTVILVDDGIATGLTMRAAIQSVRCEYPAKIIVAVPTGALDSLQELRNVADEIIALDEPAFFGAIGSFYKEFPQVSDEEVIKILSEALGARP